jgi:bifunctional enzyme CysN/CysC
LRYEKENLLVVFTGHVDHGKSTIIGRLLVETGFLPDGKVEQLRRFCERNSKPFEYAFLLDALKDEQAQGITIDAARIFFETERRKYQIIDAPGHIEFLKNMVTGASRASKAFVVIDGKEGVKENSKRHGYLLSILGISEIVVVVNKMDLVNYDRSLYNSIVDEYSSFLTQIGVEHFSFIPVSGFKGDNITTKSTNMDWYNGVTLFESLEGFRSEQSDMDFEFRMAVQDIYRFTEDGDDRRIVAGEISSGSLKVGDEIIFHPSGKSTYVDSIELFSCDSRDRVDAGRSVGFTLREQIYIKRGEIVSLMSESSPSVSQYIEANIFWLGKEDLILNQEYTLKLETEKTDFVIDSIEYVLNSSSLSINKSKNYISQNEVGRVRLKLKNRIAFETADRFSKLSRFVIVDNFNISGGGIIVDYSGDEHQQLIDQVKLRDQKWIESSVTPEMRSLKYKQNPALIIITGRKGSGRKSLAEALELKLFKMDKQVYFMGMGNIVYGLDADIRMDGRSNEHIRRLSEVANLMVKSGMILIVTIQHFNNSDLSILRTIVDDSRVVNICLSGYEGCQLDSDLHFERYQSGVEDRVIDYLYQHDIIQ